MFFAKLVVASVPWMMVAGSLLVVAETEPEAATAAADEGKAVYADEKSLSVPVPPPGRIADDAAVFSESEAAILVEKLRRDLDQLYLETGCQIYLATVAEGGGNSAKKAAEKRVEEWVPARVPGAVLVYDRQSNSFGVSATDAALEMIPAYLFALMEQTATSARGDGGTPGLVALALGDLQGLFQKHFNENAKKDHPALRADAVLFAVVSGAAVLIVAVVALLRWRQQKRGIGI
jgi:hypothetical protein